MPTDDLQDRPGFTELLAKLSDSDVVIEVAAGGAAQRTPDAAPVRRLHEAVEVSYRALGGGKNISLQTVAMLEEVGQHSLSLWLRVRSGDDALASGEDESSLKFLARGTLAMIAWMDGSPTLQLADLQQALRVLVWGTSVTTAAHPALPSSGELVKAVTAWQRAKEALNPNDQVRIITNNGSSSLDLTRSMPDPSTLLQARKLVNHSAEMIFVVEMPDYQGSGQWPLKHGAMRTVAYCEPGTMLDKFYRRELDIRPGDALRCRVDFETSYGPDHEVLAERYRIVEILEVLTTSSSENAAAPATPTDERPTAPRHAEEVESAAS
jgi:hypothetical protein